MKKIIALVLALAMVALCAVAFAADHTITINQPQRNDGTPGAEQYTMYKIFDVTKNNTVTEDVTTQANIGTAGTAKGFSYTIAAGSDWVSVLGGFTGTDGAWVSAQGQSFVTLAKIPGDASKYNVVVGEGLDSASEAKDFAEYLLAHKGNIAANKTMTSDGATASAEVADGYWLIASTLGTNLVLATTNITINTKNEYVTDNKTVPDNDYNVGDKVPFTITVNLPASIDYAKDVTVHDTMDNVLSLIDSKYDATTNIYGWKAEIKSTGEYSDFTSHVTLETGKLNEHVPSHTVGNNQVGYDFVLDIDSLASAPADYQVKISYYAELTSAALADTQYVNTEFTEYSKYETKPHEVKVKTYDFDLHKTFANVSSGNQKDYEATFALYQSDGTTAINLIFDQDKEYLNYVKGDSDDGATTNQFKVKGDTTVNVRGLDTGTYIVKEIATSNGFNTMTDPITVTIDDDGKVSYVYGSAHNTNLDEAIPVENQSGTVLPSTGGIGTTIFYILGGLLVVGAAVILVARRKASN